MTSSGYEFVVYQSSLFFAKTTLYLIDHRAMGFPVILHNKNQIFFHWKESQNITLDALINRCHIKGATKLQTKIIVSTTKIDKNTANISTGIFHNKFYFVTSNHISRYRKLN